MRSQYTIIQVEPDDKTKPYGHYVGEYNRDRRVSPRARRSGIQIDHSEVSRLHAEREQMLEEFSAIRLGE